MTYENMKPEEMILRDRLAIDRTHLANERTLLAYVRTAFMLLIAGATAIKALPADRAAVISGWLLAGAGLIVGLFGVRRFLAMRRRIPQTEP